jgi:hypothetical protein
MAELFGKRHSRQELASHVGSMSQLAGITFSELIDGRARGIRAAEFRTGSGFGFTVLLDRAMDIARADFCGKSLCWRSVSGDTHPAYYDPAGLGWLWGFGGGLVTTCGLASFGGPCEDAGDVLGLHGRVSNAPAERVSVIEEWRGDDYVLELSGQMVEARTFFGCLRLNRSITTKLGAKSLTIRDEVTNLGPRPAPQMILYHCNLGYPALSAESRVLAPSVVVVPNTAEAEKGKQDWSKAAPPTRGYAEKVYEHELAAKNNRTAVALVNEACDGGFGVYLRFRRDQLPVFTQWKMMGEQEYVMGLEPGTNGVKGRASERERGRLTMLPPGESRQYDLEIGVLSGCDEIAAMEKEIKAMRNAPAKIGSFA